MFSSLPLTLVFLPTKGVYYSCSVLRTNACVSALQQLFIVSFEGQIRSFLILHMIIFGMSATTTRVGNLKIRKEITGVEFTDDNGFL